MLDERVKSSLSEQTISFEPYSPQQLKEILSQRVQYAFHPNALDAEVVNVAAAHAAKLGGDARIAIECLLRAGREAEKENAEKVNVQHLRRIFSEVDPRALQKASDFLSADEKLILSLVPANSDIASGDLFEKYGRASKRPLTQRRFRTLISGLEKKSLVNSKDAIKSPRGRTRMIALAFPKSRLGEKP
jgi:cell division control protein 6